MSFQGCYRVISAWQKAAKMVAISCFWRLLLWMVRNADDKTLSVTRSQARLAQELGITERTVNTAIKFWREQGVIHVLEHGGGRRRKPARYQIDLINLDVYALRCLERATEAEGVRELRSADATRKSKVSGVSTPTPETPSFLELGRDARTSGVERKLQKFDGGFRAQLPKPMISDSSDSSSEKKRSEEARPLARSPEGRLTGASEGAVVVNINSAIRKLLDVGHSDADVSRMLRSHGVTVDDVRSARCKT